MIRLNDKWGIKFNELSVDVLEIRVNQKTGKEYTTPRFYFPNLETALCGITDRSLVDCESWKCVVDQIKELKAEIKEMVSQINAT